MVPFALNANWNIISRTILPVIYQEDITPVARPEKIPPVVPQTKPPPGAPQPKIEPVISQAEIFEESSQDGLGDTLQSFFFSPQKPTGGGLIWGVGPVFLLPTATEELLGADKWGAGPTAVALKQAKGWTCGMLANHIWSFAGEDGRKNVNATSCNRL